MPRTSFILRSENQLSFPCSCEIQADLQHIIRKPFLDLRNNILRHFLVVFFVLPSFCFIPGLTSDAFSVRRQIVGTVPRCRAGHAEAGRPIPVPSTDQHTFYSFSSARCSGSSSARTSPRCDTDPVPLSCNVPLFFLQAGDDLFQRRDTAALCGID